MGKRRFFLGFLAILVISLISGAVHAAGYTCDTEYTWCYPAYYLEDGDCKACTSAMNNGKTKADDTITNGVRHHYCAGSYTGGTGQGGSGDAAAQCTGCKSEVSVCECDTGYTVKNQYSDTCSCEAGCSTSVACSTLGSEWSGTYDECKQDQGSKCSKSCSVRCSGEDTSACPAHASCTYATSHRFTGIAYYGGSCSATSGLCPVDTITCDEGYTRQGDICVASTEPCNTSKPCSSLGSGYSGTYDECKQDQGSKCIKNCSNTCSGNNTSACPAHAKDCTYDSTFSYDGEQFYGGNCNATGLCPLSSFTCEEGYIKNGATCDDKPCETSVACSTLSPYDWSGTYNGCTGDQGSKCSKSCFKTCSGDDTSLCPANAECSYNRSYQTEGTIYYGGSCNAKQVTCPPNPNGFSCNATYYKNGNACSSCATGTYSTGGATSCTPCSNKPSYSYYTGNAASNNCPWACDASYYKNGSACSSCATGTYSTGGATSCTPCSNKPSNSTYTGNATSNSCSWQCNSGYYRSGNSCLECPAGSKCDGANPPVACTGNTWAAAGSSSCTACLTGYTIRGNDRTSAAQCKIDCGAGTRVATQNALCTTPTGDWYVTATHTVSQGSTSPSGTVVQTCPSGYHISGAAASDHDAKNDCKISCAAGTRVVAADATCTTPSGSWYTGAHTVAAGSTSTVSSCNSGYATPSTTVATDHDNVTDCSITCQAGYYIPTAGQGCQKCTGGKYCNGGTKNQLETLGVTGSCPAGTYSTCGATSSTCLAAVSGCTATVCATDMYSDVGASSCTACNTGNGYHTKGSTTDYHAGVASCKADCKGNEYVLNQSGGCISVGTGYYGRAAASTLVSQNATLGRTQCPANYRVGPATDTECKCQTACAAKTYVKTAKAGCEATPVGSYSAAHNVEYCKTSNHDSNNPIMKSCPVNYRSVAADSEANCETTCNGTYVNTAKAACTNVGVGYYREPHNVKYGQTSERKACPNLNDSIGVTTKTDTANSVTMCFLANVWHTPDANTGLRRDCYHNDNANETNAEAGYVRACTDEKIVACAGGYYDNGSTEKSDSTSARGKTRICAQITDKNYYSPAQSYFTNELAKPTRENPGSSIKWYSCPLEVEVPMNESRKWGIKQRTFKTPWAASDYDKCIYPAGRCYNELFSYDSVTEECVFSDPGECPVGYYCAPNPISCPTDKNGKRGTTNGGAIKITECYIVYDPFADFQHGSGKAVCHYNTADGDYTTCEVDAKTCDAGYWYANRGSRTCSGVNNGYYSPAPNINQQECPIGGSGSDEFAPSWSACYKLCAITIPHSATIAAKETRVYGTSATTYSACSFNITCQTGYTITNNNTEKPSCAANKYTVTLDKDGGTGSTPASVECTFDSGACTLPDTSGLTRAGYSVGQQWCTETNGRGKCYNGGSTVTSNLSANGTNITLYPIWTPNVYKVVLRQADAVTQSTPQEVYLKYASGWFIDRSATLPLNRLSTIPSKTGYNFGGFGAQSGINIIASSGAMLTTEEALKFTTVDTEANVRWSADNTTCPAGTYYAGTGSTCLSCPDNHYCTGGTFATDAGADGKNACRDGGKTAANAHASSESQCYKEDLPTYVSGHGTGKQTCYFNETILAYTDNCRDKYITSCDAGYWLANTTSGLDAPDCSPVGPGYYSPEVDLNRTQCPNGGTTDVQTAASIQECFKTGLRYDADFGSGTQTCYYSYGEGENAVYNRACPDDSKVIDKCNGGYWLDKTITKLDCSPVGKNYYSETNDITRHACEGGGTTANDNTSDPHECKRDDEPYTGKHGGGKRVCYYTSGTGADAKYTTSCGKPSFDYCNDGYYYEPEIDEMDCIEVGYGYYSPYPDKLRTNCGLDEDGLVMTTMTATSADRTACITCPENMVCPDTDGPNPPKPQFCSDLTGGKYPYSDKGTTSASKCYRDCVKGEHVVDTGGHDYYGGENTCTPIKCEAGYHVENGKCVECPEGSFCPQPGPDDEGCLPGQQCNDVKSCADLGDGSWKYSAKGASSPKDCYRKCEPYDLVGGRAVPRETTVYWDNMCVYDGFDPVNNPCEIVGDKCEVKMCKSSYEMVDGKCAPCNRENALSYKAGGNCIVDVCRANFHPYGDKCVADKAECTAPNASRAEVRWNNKTNTFGLCTILECDAGFHISSNACVTDVQECAVEHGRGEREWNHRTNTWGDCIATYCEPGFTNDPYESNEPTKQCGNCKNKFGVNGELAASTYSRGCTISACMYQGEMYNLENNECNPICSVTGYEDETGTMKWDSKSHKCVRNCKDGYSMW